MQDHLHLEYLAQLQLHVGLIESPFSEAYWFEAINGYSRVTDDWNSWFSRIDNDEKITKGGDIEADKITYDIQKTI
ncbi:hypothetical protein V1503_24690 [Bacillus sp. SCS-151]|uniref:hypothetical protein n=1 Tax=Nanhaiella sioensis TaxID=3115293 RepID=UPI00397C0112